MSTIDDFFTPFGDGVGGPDALRELIGMRRDTVARYGLFAPDTVYPVYVCDECGAQEVSLSLLAPDLSYFESFSSFVGDVTGLVGALPLAPCKQCGRSNPAEPSWIGFFTYLSQAQADLFLHIEHGVVAEAFKVPLVGDPECLEALDDDVSFLEAFGFPYCHRWAWRHLVDALADKPGFHVKQLDDGFFVGLDGSGGDARKWQGWFAAHAAEAELDATVLLSQGASEGFVDGSPLDWLGPQAARAFEAGRLQLVVFYSVERYRRLLEATLLQRGIRLMGSDDPFTISLDEYACPVPVASLVRAAALAAYPVDRFLRRHLLGRLEFLEALRGVGRRMRSAFDENYLTSVRDGAWLDVRCPTSQRLLRSVDLSLHTERATLPAEAFEQFLTEEFGFDSATELFVAGD